MMAVHDQCEEEPRLCPLERTRFGTPSAIYTQITGPGKQRRTQYRRQQPTRVSAWVWVKKTRCNPGEAQSHPTLAISSSVFRPSLSMSDITQQCRRMFHQSISTVCRELDSWLNPAEAKM